MIDEQEQELEQFNELRSEVFDDIRKVWMYDTSQPLSEGSEIERLKLIERVFYKIANKWID